MRKIAAGLLLAGTIMLGFATPAFAHDVTPDQGSQCTGITTGEVKFNASNMGGEVRDIFVYLNGNLVGSLLDFTGNGSKKVDITVPAGLTGNVPFTWASDAVMHGDNPIYINWDKPKCQPEVTTTTTTTVAQSTTTTSTTSTTIPEETTTTTSTTIPQETTTTTSTTIPQETTTTTSTTIPQETTTTTTVPCEVTHTCNFPSTTVAESTTTTTVAESTTTTAVRVVEVPDEPTDEPTVSTEVPEQPLPVTGSNTWPATALGIIMLAGGTGCLVIAKARKQ